MQSVHYCEKTEKGLVRQFADDSNPAIPSISKMARSIPLKDENNNPLKMEFGYCRFKDHQVIVVQELPENAPTVINYFHEF
jgi:DNA replication licensing factor MCM3